MSTKEHKLVKLRLSDEEYNKLYELSKDQGFFMSEYLRNIININYLIKYIDVDKVVKSGKLDIGGYGIEFSTEIINDFIRQMEETVKNVDWDKVMNSVKIKPNRRVKIKPTTKVKQR